MESKVCRIAVFYDGTYFYKASNYYLHQHERGARLSFKGLHKFIVAQVAKHEGLETRHCQIVDASYFRGRLPANKAQDQDRLYTDRVIEDVLMNSNITLFQRHLKPRSDGVYKEKGIDVWLALEAYEMTSLKKYDVCVLITGDEDFVPLVSKLNTLGSRVMLIAWEFSYERDGREYETHTASELIDRVNYPIMMHKEIESAERSNDPLIDGLFLEKLVVATEQDPSQDSTVANGSEEAVSVELFIKEKGYGFIKPDSGGDSRFFHVTDVLGIAEDDICSGLRVAFVLKKGDRGLHAIKVRCDSSRSTMQ